MARSKSEINKELVELKQERAILTDVGKDSDVQKAEEVLWKALIAFHSKNEQRLSKLYEREEDLNAELKAIPSKNYQPSPAMNVWLQQYCSGVNFGSKPELYWVSDDEKYAIVRFPGSTQYVDRMTGAKYFPAEYLLFFVPGTTSYQNRVKLMTIEKRLLKDQLQQMYNKVADHRAHQLEPSNLFTK